jgi:hypothetical protein
MLHSHCEALGLYRWKQVAKAGGLRRTAQLSIRRFTGGLKPGRHRSDVFGRMYVLPEVNKFRAGTKSRRKSGPAPGPWPPRYPSAFTAAESCGVIYMEEIVVVQMN